MLIKTVGEPRQLQAVGETEDTALQGFLPMPAGLTVCSLSAEGKRYLFMVSLTECELILKGLSTQIKRITSGTTSHADRFGFILSRDTKIYVFEISTSTIIHLK